MYHTEREKEKRLTLFSKQNSVTGGTLVAEFFIILLIFSNVCDIIVSGQFYYEAMSR